jgi:pyruvate decarboxylase
MPFQQVADVLQSEVNRLKLELHNMHTQRGTGEITVGNYILTRLAQLGVTVTIDL